MITGFTATHASQPNKLFRFVAKDLNKYNKNSPVCYQYTCNGVECTEEEYYKALTYFKKGRK